MKAPAAIEVEKLRKAYKNVEVLRDVSFRVERGSIFALLGPNGAGKTTIINILTTLLVPDRGVVLIDGLDIAKRANEVRKRITLTGQSVAVDDILTGRENLILISELRHISDAKQTAANLLRQFDLEQAADRRVLTYSGGMRRRLDIAMSLIGNPSVIFLDEPTTGLDPQSRGVMWKLIKAMAANGTTVFLTTQYLEEADQLADVVAVLRQGRIAAQGSPQDLKRLVPQGEITLKFHNQKQLHESAAALRRHYHGISNDAELTLSLATDGSVREISQLFKRLEDMHIEIAEFTQKPPTLDDAFLKIINDHKETR